MGNLLEGKKEDHDIKEPQISKINVDVHSEVKNNQEKNELMISSESRCDMPSDTKENQQEKVEEQEQEQEENQSDNNKEEEEEPKDKKDRISEERKNAQTNVDTAVKKAVDAVPELKNYLKFRFALKNGDKPHLMKF